MNHSQVGTQSQQRTAPRAPYHQSPSNSSFQPNYPRRQQQPRMTGSGAQSTATQHSSADSPGQQMPQRSLAVNNGSSVGANSQISPATKNKPSQPSGEPTINNNNTGKSAITTQSFGSSSSVSHGPADSKLNSSANSSVIPSETSGVQDEEDYSETSQDHDEQDGQRPPRFNFREVDTTLTKVFVGGLAWQTKSETLHKHFSQYGDILEAVVIMDKNTGRSKGFGFVTFVDGDSAQRATANPNPVIDNRRANCNLAALGLTRRRAENSPPQTHQKMHSRDGSDYEPLYTVPGPMSMALQYSLPGSVVPTAPYTMSQTYSSPQPSQSEYTDGSNPIMVPQVYYNPTLIGYDANQQPVYSFLPSSPFFSPASYYYSPSLSSASPGYGGFTPAMVQVPVSPGVPVQVGGINQPPPPLSLPQLHPLIGTESTESMGSQQGPGAPGLSRGKSDTSEASAPEFYDGTGDSPKPVNLATVSSSLAFGPPQRIPMQQRVVNANSSPVPVSAVDGGEYGRGGVNFNRMGPPVQSSAQFVPMMAPPMYFPMPGPPVGRMHMGQGPRGRQMRHDNDTIPRFQRMNIHDAEPVSTADPSN